MEEKNIGKNSKSSGKDDFQRGSFALRGEVRLQGSSTVLPTTLEILTELSGKKTENNKNPSEDVSICINLSEQVRIRRGAVLNKVQKSKPFPNFTLFFNSVPRTFFILTVVFLAVQYMVFVMPCLLSDRETHYWVHSYVRQMYEYKDMYE